MNIQVTGRQFAITPAIRTHVEDQVNRVLGDETLHIASVNVVMEHEKNRFQTNLVVNSKSHVYSAIVEDFDLYASFDAALLKVEAQARSREEKLHKNHHPQPMRDAEPKVEIEE